MRKNLLFIVIFFIYYLSVNAVNPGVYTPKDTASKDKTWLVKGFFQDEAKLWTSPIRITGKRIAFWVPVIGATMVAIANDEKIYSNFKEFQGKHTWVSKVSPVITYGGENVTVLSISGLMYIGGLVFHNEKAKQTALLGAEALAHAGLIVTVGKLITGRQRPSADHGKDSWHWFPASFNQFWGTPQSKYDAFPSGHAIAAWSLATVIAKQYRDCRIIPILAYAAATGVGLSRITQDAHWMSDVIFGSALGYTIGAFEVKERKNTHWTLLPSAGKNNVMLSMVYNY